MKVAIVGMGWVGKALYQLFPDAYCYDLGFGTREGVNSSDVAFIAVPTPSAPQHRQGEGRLDSGIVEEVVSWCEAPLIVIRSTINPGDCECFAARYGRRIVFMPEYLGESIAHPFADMRERRFLIIGGEPADRRAVIELYQGVYHADVAIRQLSLYEAEITKLAENLAILHKLAFCQELFDACESGGADYYQIREAVLGDDPRMNRWFSFVYPEKRGAQSKCLPKDNWAFVAWAESVGASASVTRAILERNREWVQLGHRREEATAK